MLLTTSERKKEIHVKNKKITIHNVKKILDY